MAVTQNTYTGDGATVLFSFTFPYLETTDIKVSLNGTLTTAYTLANATTIQFNTAPAMGVAIRIYRVTDDAALSAQFYPGSAIRSQDLNDNFTQNLYVTQESNRDATSAIATANAATTTANSAVSTANAATATANTASSNASAAVATANTASTNASAAVSTANTASSNATTAVNTANAATATANTAASNASTALSTANSALSTANTASTNATNAVNTANSASSAASSAVSTANTASTNASNAVSTANTASSNATTAVNTANSAITTANNAAAAVANAQIFTIVAAVANIPGSPANNAAVEVTNSTGIESFTPLAGVPGGFTGNSGLSVRITYSTSGSTWNWVQYFPNDPESRYLKTGTGTVTSTNIADGTIVNADISATAAIAPSKISGTAVVDADARLTDTRTPTDGSVTNSKVSASAAIAGTKISPDFGSQNVTTTGSSTAASFIPTSSTVPSNGVYLSGTNTVAVATNSTGRLFVGSSGNVGIGGTSSDTTLKVRGTSGVNVFQPQTEAGGIQHIIFDNSALYAVAYTGGTNPIIQYSVGTQSNIPYTVLTNNTERLRITSDGKLGLGTSAPGVSLDVVAGSDAIAYRVRGRSSDGIGAIQFTDNGATTQYASIQTPAANTLAFLTQSTERLRLTSDGRLGLGTSSPGAVLHATSADNAKTAVLAGATNRIRAWGHLASFGGSVIEATNNAESAFAPLLLNGSSVTLGNNGAAIATVTSVGVGIGTTAPSVPLEVVGQIRTLDGTVDLRLNPLAVSSAGIIGTYSNHDLVFYTNILERLRIDSSGRLLVGTSSALTNYQWFGTTYIAPSLQVANENVGQASFGLFCNNAVNTSASQLMLAKAASGTAGLVDSGETLGVVVFNGADGTNLIRAASIEAAVDGTPGANDMPGRLVFSTTADGASSPTERMRIASNGDIGFNGVPLANNSIGIVDGLFGSRQLLWNRANTGNVSYALDFRNAGTNVGSISYSNTATAYNTSSDYRLKENVVPLTGAADRLNQLQVHRFNFIADPDKTVDGFIAHEAQDVVPECVTGTKDEIDADGNPVYQGIDQSKLVPLLTAALQEAMERIEALEAKVAALEGV